MWVFEAILIGQISKTLFTGHAMAIQIVVVFLAIPLTFVVGSSVIIVRHLGRDECWEANHILGQAVMIGVIMAFIIGITWYCGAIHLFKFISSTPGTEGSGMAAQRAGVVYLRTAALFAPVIITNFVAVGIIRGSGDTHLSMTVNLIINGINVILAPVLIFGLFGLPALQIKGAALAVGISHTIGLMATLYILRSRKAKLFLSFRELTTPNLKSFKRLFKTGIPTTIEQFFFAIGMLFIMIYAARMDLDTLSAHGVFVRIQNVLSMTYWGFSVGAMTLMGKSLGAEQHRTAMRTARLSGRVVLLFVLVIVVAISLFYKQIIFFFLSGRDVGVVEKASVAIYVFAIAQIPKAFLGSIMGSLRGAGDLKFLMWMTLISVLMVEVLLNYIGAFVVGLGLVGLWAVHALGESSRVCVAYWRLHGGGGKFMKKV